MGSSTGSAVDQCVHSAHRIITVFPMVDILGLATALRAAITIIKIVFVFAHRIIWLQRTERCISPDSICELKSVLAVSTTAT